MEELRSATARAFANIAFIKYWGNRDEQLRLPASPSLSMNLAGLYTDTTVRWGASEDSLTINGRRAEQAAITRVAAHLDELRNRLSITGRAAVASETNIPIGAGIASSAAAFAALTVAGVAAAGRQADEATLSALARLGSGSAARSVPGGFVAWPVSDAHETCCAHSIAAAEHWPLADVIAIVDAGEKGSLLAPRPSIRAHQPFAGRPHCQRGRALCPLPASHPAARFRRIRGRRRAG